MQEGIPREHDRAGDLRRQVDRESAQRLREVLATFDSAVVGVAAIGFGGDHYP